MTSDELKNVLTYDPETGVFTWLRPKSYGLGLTGEAAGHKAADGYIRIEVLGKKYLAHRLAYLYMTGHFPQNVIDHINRVKSDNRWSNLRPATQKQNRNNSKVGSSKSGFKGIRQRPSGKYEVRVDEKYYGVFESLAKAVDRSNLIRDSLHGEFSNCG